MIPTLIGLGVIYWALRKYDGEKEADKADEPDEPVPQPVTPEGDDYRVVQVATGEQNNIYELEGRTGLQYDDGTNTFGWSSRGFIRGNADGYIMGSAGGIDFSIGGVDYNNVIQYATKEDALEADKIPEADPSGPVSGGGDDDDEDMPELPPYVPPTGGSGGLDGYINPFGGNY